MTEKYKQAVKAVRAVNSDTSVTVSQTRELLKELQDEIQIMIDALGHDPEIDE